MSEEIVDNAIEEQVEIVEEPISAENAQVEEASSLEEVVEHSEEPWYIKDAKQKGWKDRDAWVADGRDADEWYGAKAFVKHEQEIQTKYALKDELKSLRDESKELKKELKTLFTDYTKEQQLTKEQDYLNALKYNRDAHINSGEATSTTISEYDKLLDDAKQRISKLAKTETVDEVVQQTVTTDPWAKIPEDTRDDYKDFIRRNAFWFNKDNPRNEQLVSLAANKETELKFQHPDWSSNRVFEKVEIHMNDEFKLNLPHVNRVNKGNTAPVATPKKTAVRSTIGEKDLGEMQRLVYSRLNTDTAKKDYVDKLKKLDLIGKE